MGLFSYFLKGGTVGMIARQITAFYEVLDRDFRESFIDGSALLAGAGIISANHYIFEGSISLQEVVDAAQNAQKNIATVGLHHRIIDDVHDGSKEELLLAFIFNMETLIYCADTPPARIEETLSALGRSKEKIEKYIQETRRKYKYQKNPYPHVEQSTHEVMINSMNPVHSWLIDAELLSERAGR